MRDREKTVRGKDRKRNKEMKEKKENRREGGKDRKGSKRLLSLSLLLEQCEACFGP